MDYMEACEWLQLDPKHDIDEDKLKRAFRKSAIREHPDKSCHEDSTKRFQSVKRAHTFIEQCVERGETGSNADLERTDDHNEDDYDDDDDHVDIFEHFMAHVYVSHLQHQMRSHMGGGGGGGGRSGGMPFGMRFRATHTSGGRTYEVDEDYDYDDDEDYYEYEDDEDSYDEDSDYDRDRSRRCRHHQQQEQARKESQKRVEMERKRQQAMKEGRDFFESWTTRQLQQEATRRGFKTKGMGHHSLIELLIDDEAEKRRKRELKKTATLIDEWVEIIGVSSQPHLNGIKARAIDFSYDRYTVEWEDPSLKKKSPQYRHMYGEKKRARFKPENIKRWGSISPPEDPEPQKQQEEVPTKQKKSRRARRKAAKQRQQQDQEQQKDSSNTGEEKSDETKKEASVGTFSCSHKATNLKQQNNQNMGQTDDTKVDNSGDSELTDLGRSTDTPKEKKSNQDDDLPKAKSSPESAKNNPPHQKKVQEHQTRDTTKPIFGSQANGTSTFTFAPDFSLSGKPASNLQDKNIGGSGPATTPWTTPMFGSSGANTNPFKFGDAKDSKENWKRNVSSAPSFGTSGTFIFGGPDYSQGEGEKSMFTFGSTNQEQQKNRKAENVTEEKKPEDPLTKIAREKKETNPNQTMNDKESPNTGPIGPSKKMASESSKSPEPAKQADRKPKRKEPSTDTTMDQFERLAKELGDKVDLTDDITRIQNLYNREGYIQHKVKCPKNKKPGDWIEFTNPHIQGQKQRAQVPAGTKPEKFFKVLVPLPKKEEVAPTLFCSCCLKVVVKKEEAGDDEEIGAPLRACAHYCCQACIVDIGKTCPSCKLPLPTIGSLGLLPYVKDLDNPSEVVKKALLEEYYTKKESDRLETKEAKDLLDKASAAATKAIDKHYRRASLRVHPDRFGEKFRKEFNALTKARDVFRNSELRRKYLSEMLDIVCRVDVGYIPQSHQIWIEKNDPDLQEKAAKPAASNKPGHEAPLQLDGGVAFSRPKRPRVFIQSEKAKRLKLYLPLVNEYQFLEYCKKVFVYGNCGHIDEQNIVLAEIKKSKWDLIDGQIRCEVSLPDNGMWDISWSAWLDIDGKEGSTPLSTGAKVDLRDASQRGLEGRKAAMERLAIRATNNIKACLRNSRGPEMADRQKMEALNNALHPVVARGRDISVKLEELLRGTGETTSSSLTALLGCLQDALGCKAQLEKSLESYGKRDARRAFKDAVAHKLERGDAEKWVNSIVVEDLKTLGGDSNRLYQLLIEGKKANSLAFNDTTIEAAEGRTDIFTPKQIEALKRRRMEVQALNITELELAVEEAENLMAEDLIRKEMEKKAAEVTLHFGDAVKIHDLGSRADLNGATGRYLGLAQGDRYTIRLDRNGKEVALKASNFSAWDGAYVSHWSCNACTYRHEGILVAATCCDVCGVAKGAPAPVDQPKQEHASRRKTKDVEQYDSQKQCQTKCAANGSKASAPVKTKEPNGPFAAKGSKQNIPAEVPRNMNIRPAQTKKHSTRPIPMQPLPTKNTFPPSNLPNLIVGTVGLQQGLKNEIASNFGVKPALPVNPNVNVSGYCMRGLHCPDLQEGPEACMYLHTKEEIAYYHSNHPGVIALSVLDFEPKDVFEKAPVPQENRDVSNVQKPPATGMENPIRCKYGGSCKNLRRGVDKCKFFHTPEDFEIASQKRKKQKKACRHGVDCQKLRRGPNACPFYHTPEQIGRLHPDFEGSVAGTNSTMKDQRTPTQGTNAATGLNISVLNSREESNANVLRAVNVPADTIPLVVGKNGKRIQDIIKKSGAHLALTKAVDANGMRCVNISGTEEAVRVAADLVIETTSPKVSDDVAEEDHSDDVSGLTADSTPFPTGISRPSIVTPSAGSGGGDSSLLFFLQAQKACLKCPPARFHQWLTSVDILTITDLAEACEDEDYHGELQNNGLKGFKRGPFLKAVANAAGGGN